jgi:hypothetical protein
MWILTLCPSGHTIHGMVEHVQEDAPDGEGL